MVTHVHYIPRVKNVFDMVSDYHYAVNEKGKFKWLQRIALKVLRKFGSACKYHSTIIEAKQIEFKKVVDLIMDNINAIHYIDNLNCKYIIIGRDKMKELYTDEYMKFYVPMDADLRRDQRKFLGMNIIIVPWINGVFCLPEIN